MAMFIHKQGYFASSLRHDHRGVFHVRHKMGVQATAGSFILKHLLLT